jgi:hypothetical protein
MYPVSSVSHDIVMALTSKCNIEGIDDLVLYTHGCVVQRIPIDAFTDEINDNFCLSPTENCCCSHSTKSME